LSVVDGSRDDLDDALAAHLRGETHPRVLLDRRRPDQQRRLAWVFTGMGPQWWGMGRELFAAQPAYRDAVERCDHEIAELTGWSLTEAMAADEAGSRMAETWLAQPANFAVQVGLSALWRAHGVRPDAIVGHSTGEVAAFHEAGVYSLRDAVRIVVHRSRLQQRLAGTGTMLAAGLTEEEALRRLRPYGDQVSLAAVNSPAAVTFAGDRAALTALAGELHAGQVFAKFLTVRVPYHSARMEEIKDELLSSLAGIEPRPARVPLYLTGREGRAVGTELDADYWWSNVRDSVRFRQAVERMAGDGHRTFLEIGPHPVLTHAIKECLAGVPVAAEPGAEAVTLPSIRRGEDEEACFTA
ncbi:acyltransferase domain-containing protein, partial [Streptomyces goshikiensis]